MGPTIKHPITGSAIGKIEGKEIKDSHTGKVTGVIEDDDEGYSAMGWWILTIIAMLALAWIWSFLLTCAIIVGIIYGIIYGIIWLVERFSKNRSRLKPKKRRS